MQMKNRSFKDLGGHTEELQKTEEDFKLGKLQAVDWELAKRKLPINWNEPAGSNIRPSCLNFSKTSLVSFPLSQCAARDGTILSSQRPAATPYSVWA
jgi:hypothetical protein